MIDWKSEKNEVLFNPRMPESAHAELYSATQLIDTLKGQLCFATSGTSGKLKWVLLSKSGLLASAHAVNAHLNSDRNDIWLNSLPDFHVGGVGIVARAYLSGAEVIPCHFQDSKWSPAAFHKQLDLSHATLTSLVPTQVFDLISLRLEAPSSLRAVVVGGGALSEQVYLTAVKLGWKLLPSYGLTECASQVATAEYDSWNLNEYPLLRPLGHVQVALDGNGFLKVKSESLLTAYLETDNSSQAFVLRDPKTTGWLTTEDKAVFEGEFIKSITRGENFIKICGESVDLLRLEKILEDVKLALGFSHDATLTAIEDERVGYLLHLAVTTPVDESVMNLVAAYQQRVFPFERLHQIHHVNQIPRSPLNKPLKAALNELITKT